MSQGIRPLVTTGVALVGASVIAVSPLTAPPPEVQALPLPAAQRVVDMSDVQLTGLAEDLTRFVTAVVNAPGTAVSGVGQALDGLPDDLENAASTREAIGLIATAIGNVYASPIRAFLNPLIVNASPNEPADQDFIDATLLAIRDLVDEPLFIPTIPLNFLTLWGDLGFTPLQAAGLIVAGYGLKPLVLAGPFVAALANALPAPWGGDLASNDPADWGRVYNTFDEFAQAVQNLVLGIVLPDQMIQAKQDMSVQKVAEDPWPPNAETTRRVLASTARSLLTRPEALGNLAIEDVRRIGAYLEEGRPLDAVRLLASHALSLPMDLARIPVNLGATFLPPPVGGVFDPPAPAKERGLLVNGYLRTAETVNSIANHIGPQVPLQHSQIESSGPAVSPQNSGNVLDLKLPRLKNRDEGNLIVSQGVDKDDTTVKKTDDTRRPGGNVRAVVKEVRKDIRETVKDVRQGVRDVVRAVTGLDKKKEVKAAPKPE